MYTIRECIGKMSAYVPGESTEDETVVKLNQNENRYPPSPRVEQAVARAMDHLSLYPDSTSTGLRQAAAQVYGVEPDQVMATNGSDEMLRLLFQASCDPGDEAVAFYPSYTYYNTLAAMHDVPLRLIDFEGEYAIPARLELSKAKLVLLPNPNAPTGTLFPESELRRLIEAAPDAVVVIDEAYADYSGYTAIPLIRDYDNVVIARTFSKSYSLAGFRIGLGIARKELLAEIEKIRDFYNVDRLAQAGGEAALLDQDWLKYVSDQIIETRNRSIRAVRELGLNAYDSAANFFMVRCSSPEKAKAIFEGLRSRNVFVRYFSNRGISDCLRVSVGTDSDMDIFLRELANVLGAM